MGKENVTSRRKLIRGSIGLGIGAAVIGNEVGKLINDGVYTDIGTFVPMYEKHKEGPVRFESIPHGLHSIFLEYQTADNEAAALDKFSSFLHPDTRNYLASQHISAIWGDVRTPTDEGNGTAVLVEAGLGCLIGFNMIVDHLKRGPISRRDSLRQIATAGLLWSSAPLVSGHLANLLQDNRIATRLHGSQFLLHPELATIFFRNIKFALSIFSAAEYFKNSGVDQPRIGINVGIGHSGIEELLQLGPDHCRALMLAYPKDFLQATVSMNAPNALPTSHIVDFATMNQIDVVDIVLKDQLERKSQ